MNIKNLATHKNFFFIMVYAVIFAKEISMKHRDTLFWKNFQIAIIVFLLFCTINTASAQTTMPVEAIAEKALAATVYLEMKDTDGRTLGIGSGFFVKPNLIATNYHMIEGAANGTAKRVGKSTTYNIEGVTATDKKNDLALLKVKANGIKPLSIGDSNKIQIWETVYVTWSPGGSGMLSKGIISSTQSKDTKERIKILGGISGSLKNTVPPKLIKRRLPTRFGSSFFPGSSGCPVLNTKGEVVGMSFITFEGGGISNFAIPSETLKKLMKQAKTVKPLAQEKKSISAETYLLWGNLKYDLRDYASAIKDYTAAIQLNPDFVKAYINRGYANGRLQYPDETIADYIADVDTAIQINPNNAYAYYNRGIINRMYGQHADEIADYDTAIRLKPDYVKAYINRGNAKISLGQRGAWMKVEIGYYAAAISDYDTAIQLEPDNAYAYHRRGEAKAGLGQYANAIADYDIAIQLNPYNTYYYIDRGNAKSWLEQHVAAIADYDIAIRLKPDAIYAYYCRGSTKSLLGQHAEAIADYETIILIDPDDGRAYYHRGNVKAELGQYAEAIADYDEAILFRSYYAKAYYQRGNAKKKLGRTSEAEQDFRTALRIAINTEDANLKTAIEEALRILNE